MRNWWLTIKGQFGGKGKLEALADITLFARIFLFAASVPALLRFNIPQLQWVLEPGNLPPFADPKRVQKITACVNVMLNANMPFIRPGCLTRGITLYYFLKRSGLNLKLSFGLGEIEGRYVGHCWLVRDGAPYLESRDPRPVFAEVFSIPLSRPVAGRYLEKGFRRMRHR